MPRLKTVSLLAALLGLCAAPAIAQECRSNFGGAYTFLDSGLKPPDSRPFSAIAKFDFNPAGTFSIDAVISISGVGVLSSAAVSTWRWTGPCDIRVEEGFVGHLNRDGRFSSFVALDDVAAVGIMTRDAAVPDHTAAQAIGSQNAFSETLFGRVFAGALADQFTGRAGALRA